MKDITKLRLAILLCLSIFPVDLSRVLAQGSLAPPGAPGPTMKSLDQIEPRTPISSLPFTITQPGSYYLKGNLTGTGSQNGITISADNVTLDLMGFSLNGVASSLVGVTSTGTRKNITIVNGVIQGWGSNGLKFDSSGGTGCILERLIASGNGSVGIFCNIPGTIFRRCSSSANTGDGFNAGTGALIMECSASSNIAGAFVTGDGSTVHDCVAQANGASGGHGFSIGNYSTLINSSVSNHQLSAAASFVAINAGNGCVIKDCVLGHFKGDGMIAGSANTITGCTVSDSLLSQATGIGVVNGNTIIGNTVRNMTGNGIALGASNLVRNNTLDTDGQNTSGGGIGAIYVGDEVNFIEDNAIIFTPIGFALYAKNTVVIHNNIALATTPFQFVTTPEFVGQTIKAADLTGNAYINNTSNPWANFEIH
jgi:hypothetical protein